MGRIKIDQSKWTTEAERQARDEAERARRYLAETDWYVTRAAETGKPIPDDIKTAREDARQIASRRN